MASWEEPLQRLLRRGKVHAAAVLDGEGGLLACTPHPALSAVTPREGAGLVKAATCHYPRRFSLALSGTVFTCLHQEAPSVLLGCGEGVVLAAKRARDGVVVVGLASAESPGSCLYEVTEFARLLKKSARKRDSFSVDASSLRKLLPHGSGQN